MKLTLQLHDVEYSIESEEDDFLDDELKEKFSRLLVVAGYPPSVMSPAGGRYEYVEDDEVVAKESYLQELQESKKNET